MSDIYLSVDGTNWQSGDSNVLLPFAAYDTTLSQLNDPVNAMIPECRQFNVPVCRSKTKKYPDIFKITKMPGDRLNYEVDFSNFSEAVEDDVVQQFFVVDEGFVGIDGIGLVDNKVGFMLSDSSQSSIVRLIVDTESGLRKVVPIYINC